MAAPGHPFFAGLTPTVPIAHRGGAALYPENTLFAFKEANDRHGARMIETDVHLSADGEVVISHDPTVDRCTDGRGAIAQLSLAQLKALDAGARFEPEGPAPGLPSPYPFRGHGLTLPTLREALRAFPQMRFNVDVKARTPGIEEAVAKVIHHEGAVERVCVGTEFDDQAAALHALLREACHFYPREALTALVMALKTGDRPPDEPRYTVLDMPLFLGELRLVDRALVEGAARLGKWINVWTIDDEVQMRQLVADGVGGIMTDRPDVLARVLHD